MQQASLAPDLARHLEAHAAAHRVRIGVAGVVCKHPSDAQRQHLLEGFNKRTEADAAGTPLWLTIVAQSVAPWASYDGITFGIKPAVRDLITDLFESLQKDHGPALVRAALAYITLAKDGVSETELNHLLSLDDDVLASV